jgi:hypothetical protein
MTITKATGIPGNLGILFSLLITMFIASDARVQAQTCECYDTVSAVRVVRRAPVRRVARRAKVKRTYARRTYNTTYVPVAREVTYAPRYVAYVDDDDCDEIYVPTSRVYVNEPVYTTARVGNVYYTGSAYNTTRIASGWGQRDGFKDGWKAAKNFRSYNPQNNDDFWDANNGYRRRFGDKHLYKASYRSGYLRGYASGWRSINNNGAVGVIRY